MVNAPWRKAIAGTLGALTLLVSTSGLASCNLGGEQKEAEQLNQNSNQPGNYENDDNDDDRDDNTNNDTNNNDKDDDD